MFKKVCKKEEVFWGDSVEDFPDIVLCCHEKYKISTKLRNSNLSRGDLVAIEKGWKKVTGGHKQYGICIVNGPGCRSDSKLDTIDITDIFPTVLYQLGVPIPTDVDGKIINGIFRDDFLKEHPVVWEDTTTHVESEPEYMYNKDEEKK